MAPATAGSEPKPTRDELLAELAREAREDEGDMATDPEEG